MDWTSVPVPGLRAGGGSLSTTSTVSTTLMPTPTSSEAGGIDPRYGPVPTLAPVPAGPLYVTALSTTDWRPRYPRIGQFAITRSEEVVAAYPDGLIYFNRVDDHASKPWSEPRPLPPTTARLDASTVTGLALLRDDKGVLHVYCVANGVSHAFSCSAEAGSTFVVDSTPPFEGASVSGTPAIGSITVKYRETSDWCVVAPCPSGGILYTCTTYSTAPYGYSTRAWEPAKHTAAHMGIISAVSVAVMHRAKITSAGNSTQASTKYMVAIIIARARLYTIQGPFEESNRSNWHPAPASWQTSGSIRIQHPGEVTGNPVLLSKDDREKTQLDLLVPSAEGGIFHFIQTPKTPDEWHMIGRISFPPVVPIVSSLSFACLGGDYGRLAEFRAHVQCGGHLYLVKTLEGACPWVGSFLYPIEGPGPFSY